MKTAYVGMAADYIHEGHIHIIEQANRYGKVIVGLLTDNAIASYKRIPLTSWKQRKRIIENLRGVNRVVRQDTLDYTDNILKYKPDYVVHGDDWKKGIQKKTRDKAIQACKSYGGQVIDIHRLNVPSSTELIDYKEKNGIPPEHRKRKLSKLLELKPYLRVLETHNGLSGIIVEQSDFDCIWISSLTDSTAKGKPDIEIVDFSSRCNTINEILEVTTKPIIVDGDTGGDIYHFRYMVKTLERLGVSAVIIEDKKFPKQNSLLMGAEHKQEDIQVFCDKIKAGIQSKITQDFMVIARIESLIAGKDSYHAASRAEAYINAGADAIMIHSKKKDIDDIKKFCEYYKTLDKQVPLVMVPTTYNEYTEDELHKLGANIIIYANHLLRSSYKAMLDTANIISEKKRSKDVDKLCVSVEEILHICQI